MPRQPRRSKLAKSRNALRWGVRFEHPSLCFPRPYAVSAIKICPLHFGAGRNDLPGGEKGGRFEAMIIQSSKDVSDAS